jgi:hypothetical protein
VLLSGIAEGSNVERCQTTHWVIFKEEIGKEWRNGGREGKRKKKFKKGKKWNLKKIDKMEPAK